MESMARTLWLRTEPLHAVVYFDAQCREMGRSLGLKGYWMGYFATRSAPLGRAQPSVVTAAFGVFAPGPVARALPASWDITTPERALDLRAERSAAALRALDPELERRAERLTGPLRAMVADAPALARPVFAANRALPDRADPVEQVWQLTTSLREFRGDAHLAVLADRGLDGCEALLLAAADGRVPADSIRQDRGWTAEEWAGAGARLRERGLLAAGGALTERGRDERRSIEDDTDRLAGRLLRPLSGDRAQALFSDLAPVMDRVLAGQVLPFPNPIGLPRPVRPL
ncbi:hypothetical protein G3I68_09450 [Streptomyces sp. SID13588]|nr:hypothetical protein [Streptomyces sp. SID13588]